MSFLEEGMSNSSSAGLLICTPNSPLGEEGRKERERGSSEPEQEQSLDGQLVSLKNRNANAHKGKAVLKILGVFLRNKMEGCSLKVRNCLLKNAGHKECVEVYSRWMTKYNIGKKGVQKKLPTLLPLNSNTYTVPFF